MPAKFTCVLLVTGLAIVAVSSPQTLGQDFPQGPVVMEGFPATIQARLEARQRRVRRLPSRVDAQPMWFVLTRLNLWVPGQTVRVSFKDGSTELHQKIENVAKEWTQFGNLHLDFGYTEAARQYARWSQEDIEYVSEIRVSFDHPDGGYWSLVGTDCVDSTITKPSEASMNLHGFKTALPSDWRTTVLHEFGHALGFQHEHQNPDGGCDSEFRWNDDPGYDPDRDGPGGREGARPGVYTVLSWQVPPWPEWKVDHNLRQLPNSENLIMSPHDPDSIMHYLFDEWMFVLGDDSHCFTDFATDLSAGDREGMATAYLTGDPVEEFLKTRENTLATLMSFEKLQDVDKTCLARQMEFVRKAREGP